MKQFLIRLLTLIAGLFLYALGIVFTLKANIGYAPWDVFHAGFANTIGVSIGVATILTGIVTGTIVTILGEKFGLGMVGSIVLTGVFVDVILKLGMIPVAKNTIIGMIMLVIGLLIMSAATYFYIKSAFGAGPRDNLMVVLVRKTKLPVGACRCIVEVSVTLAGWGLGGMFGIGTVVSAIAVGFFIQIIFRLFQFDATAVEHETLLDTYRALARLKAGAVPEEHATDVE